MSGRHVDPVCGMQVGDDTYRLIGRAGLRVFFCSRRCAEEYARREGPAVSLCCLESPSAAALSIWRRPVFAVALIPVVLTLGAHFWSPLASFPGYIAGYLSQIGGALMLGLFIGGIIDRYVPREYVSSLLSSHRRGSLGLAVGLGLVMSACSHGILALAMELHRKGASTPTVVAFLLASPWANLPITVLLLALFGAKALYIILGAVLVALVTGSVFVVLEKRGWVESNPSTVRMPEDFSIRRDIVRRWRQRRWSVGTVADDARRIFAGGVRLAEMIVLWVVLGMTLSALAASLVPPRFFRDHLGPDLAGMASTLGLATVLEVCSECTAPLAFELFKQTGAYGNVFIFLMAGVVTDYTEIGALWANIGRRTAILVPLISVPLVLLLGWYANRVFI